MNPSGSEIKTRLILECGNRIDPPMIEKIIAGTPYETSSAVMSGPTISIAAHDSQAIIDKINGQLAYTRQLAEHDTQRLAAQIKEMLAFVEDFMRVTGQERVTYEDIDKLQTVATDILNKANGDI